MLTIEHTIPLNQKPVAIHVAEHEFDGQAIRFMSVNEEKRSEKILFRFRDRDGMAGFAKFLGEK